MYRFRFRFERQRRRIYAMVLDIIPGTGGCQRRVGSLGSIPYDGPTVADYVRFHAALDDRLRAIDDKHPGRLTADDVARIRAKIAERIPTPATAAETRALRAIREAAKQLEELRA